jgi:hypothetical protein
MKKSLILKRHITQREPHWRTALRGEIPDYGGIVAMPGNHRSPIAWPILPIQRTEINHFSID